MHTETYSSPTLKSAGAIVDLTAAAHIDCNSPEPPMTYGTVSGMWLHSPEPLSTKPSAIDFTYVRPSLKSAGTIIDMTAAAHIDQLSPEPPMTYGTGT